MKKHRFLKFRQSEYRLKQRKPRGVSAIEICIACFLMIVFAAVCLDITLVIFGYSVVDAVTRDAARAAAQQTTNTQALAAAQSALRVHATDGVFITQPVLVSQNTPNFVYQDYAGSPPANTSPYVTVTCSLTVNLPAVVFFSKNVGFNGNAFTLMRRYTFPIVKTKFYG